MNKARKHTIPLLSALTTSMLCASLVAAVSAHGVYQKYNTDGWSQPLITVLMQGLAHHDTVAPSVNTDADAVSVSGHTGIDSRQETGQPGNDAGGRQDPLPNPDTAASGPEATDPPEEPESYRFTNVTRDYFDDALFIGDSRVTGVELYSGWNNITYYAENGMTIYNMFSREAEKEDGRTLTVEEALQTRSFGKIYLEIGINEMGTGNTDSFMEAYEKAVTRLQELQPEAIIYICGIMYVKQSKSESDPIFNNPNIRERNERIAALADGKNIFYLDINELVTDETGNLNPDYTWDEVHLLGKYDALWLEYFCSHGILKNA